MKEVITEEQEQGEDITTIEPLFPRLEKLYFKDLPTLWHFFLRNRALEFPVLRVIDITRCPMKTFVQQGPASTPGLIKDPEVKDDFNIVMIHEQLFNSKVFCPSLEELQLHQADGITALCSHQLPTGYFCKLKKLKIWCCVKLRNLMPPSVAKGLVNIQSLEIYGCPSMEEAITEEEEQQEGEDIMTKESLFPQLETLKLFRLPKLEHFFLKRRALEFPSLKEVQIKGCPKITRKVRTVSIFSTGANVSV